jgi:hypothetical protein
MAQPESIERSQPTVFFGSCTQPIRFASGFVFNLDAAIDQSCGNPASITAYGILHSNDRSKVDLEFHFREQQTVLRGVPLAPPGLIRVAIKCGTDQNGLSFLDVHVLI